MKRSEWESHEDEIRERPLVKEVPKAFARIREVRPTIWQRLIGIFRRRP